MSNLDVISVNLWQILISLINLVLLYRLLKRFLYAPVKAILAERQEALSRQYEKAERAQADADRHRAEWEHTLKGVHTQADTILRRAREDANRHSDMLIAAATAQADGIRMTAERDADTARKQATEAVHRELADISCALTEKLLQREIRTEDHRQWIEAFINELGDSDG